jgi:hypothetical protein
VRPTVLITACQADGAQLDITDLRQRCIALFKERIREMLIYEPDLWAMQDTIDLLAADYVDKHIAELNEAFLTYTRCTGAITRQNNLNDT